MALPKNPHLLPSARFGQDVEGGLGQWEARKPPKLKDLLIIVQIPSGYVKIAIENGHL